MLASGAGDLRTAHDLVAAQLLAAMLADKFKITHNPIDRPIVLSSIGNMAQSLDTGNRLAERVRPFQMSQWGLMPGGRCFS